jgi:hypothetical protein
MFSLSQKVRRPDFAHGIPSLIVINFFATTTGFHARAKMRGSGILAAGDRRRVRLEGISLLE